MLQRSDKDIERGKEQQLEMQQGRHFLSPIAQMDRMFDEFFRRPLFSLWSQRVGVRWRISISPSTSTRTGSRSW